MPREESHHGAGKRVARAGRIDDLFQWIRGHREHPFVTELKDAVFAALDENRGRSHLQDRAASLHQVVLSREQARLLVATKQDLDSLEHPGEARASALDPIVKKIGYDHLGTEHLVEYVFLEIGIVRRQVQIVGAALVRQ